MDEIYQVCDAATIFKDGEYVACMPLEELPKLKLISLMIGRDASELVNKRKKYDPDKVKSEVICRVVGVKKATRG